MKTPGCYLFRELYPILLLSSLILSACRTAPEAENLPVSFEPYTIVFVGDILLADAAQTQFDENGYEWPFENLGQIAGDYLIGNAEGPITTRKIPFDPNQRWSYNAQPQAAQALAEFGFNALGLSNNHAMDRGPNGLADTLETIRNGGMSAFGAGMNLTEASAPLLIETPYGLVAVVALSEDWGIERTAAEDRAGTIPLSPGAIRRGYDLAVASGARWVAAYVHWGANYAHVSQAQRRSAREFAAAGYDLVIGHGAHSLQEAAVVKGVPVIYSLGNFVFTTPGRFTEEFPGYGLLASIALGPDGFFQAEFLCIKTDNQVVHFQPRPCTQNQAEEVFSSLYPDLTIIGSAAFLSW